MTERNGKATIREVRDLIDKLDDEKISPMRIDIGSIKTELIGIKKAIEDLCQQSQNFISRPVFFGWLSALVVAVSVVITIIKLG